MPETAQNPADSWRQRLAAFADALIPGGAGLPSASAADVHQSWIDRTFDCRPDLTAMVMKVIGGTADPADELKRLRQAEPDLFENFAFAIAGAYFMNPEVRQLVGYPGPAPLRKRPKPGEAEDYLRGGLLDPVIKRGPIYRIVPT
jgi:hypothetical protein